MRGGLSKQHRRAPSSNQVSPLYAYEKPDPVRDLYRRRFRAETLVARIPLACVTRERLAALVTVSVADPSRGGQALRCHLWLTFSIADQVVVHRQAATRAAIAWSRASGLNFL